MKTESQNPASAAKRAEIVQHAYEVFYQEGFNAAGIDRIMQDSGISKRTLYKYFDSKEDLIQETLKYYHSLADGRMSAFIESQPSGKPGDRTLRVFDFLESVVMDNEGKGCFAMNAKSEYANRNPGIEGICETYLNTVEKRIETYLIEDGFEKVQELGLQIWMLFQGAVFSSQMKKTADPVRSAKAAAQILLLECDRNR